MSTSHINTEQVLKYLGKAFHTSIQRAIQAHVFNRDNKKGTELYDLQIEFCYLTDEIARGPAYIVPKRITKANEMIENIIGMVSDAED